MDNNGWKPISTCPVAESAKDARYIIVWHVFQRVMVYSTLNARANRFNAYWQEPPVEWIDPRERLPTKEDADAQLCVLAIDTHNDVRVRVWNQVHTDDGVRGWVPCPAPPDDHDELRRNAD